MEVAVRSRPTRRRDESQDEAATAHARILLVEDNPVNQKVACALLGRRGHEVTVAHHGAEGVERFKQERFDLVLMDVQMPVMNGFDATAAIRRHESERGLRRTPIVAMTALAMKGDKERCLEAGMDAYVSKPIRATEVFLRPRGHLEATPG